MDRLTYDIVAAKRERHIADTTANHRMRQRCLDLACRLDKIETVSCVFFDTSRDRKNIRVENDVGGVEAQLFGENPVRTLANTNLAFHRIGLPVFVESHYDNCSTVVPDQLRLFDEGFLPLLEAD